MTDTGVSLRERVQTLARSVADLRLHPLMAQNIWHGIALARAAAEAGDAEEVKRLTSCVRELVRES